MDRHRPNGTSELELDSSTAEKLKSDRVFGMTMVVSAVGKPDGQERFSVKIMQNAKPS